MQRVVELIGNVAQSAAGDATAECTQTGWTFLNTTALCPPLMDQAGGLREFVASPHDDGPPAMS